MEGREGIVLTGAVHTLRNGACGGQGTTLRKRLGARKRRSGRQVGAVEGYALGYPPDHPFNGATRASVAYLTSRRRMTYTIVTIVATDHSRHVVYVGPAKSAREI